MKQIYLNYFLFFGLGILITALVISVYEEPGRKITFLPRLEIQDNFLPFLKISGSYVKENGDLRIISLECRIDMNTCTESSVFCFAGWDNWDGST